jgi:purine nucleoside permease
VSGILSRRGVDPALKFAQGGALAGFEAAYQVGAPVVKALVGGWPGSQKTPPGAPARLAGKR